MPDAGFTMNDPPETDDAAIARLARLPQLEYERVRDAEAERLGCRVSALDKMVATARGEKDTTRGRSVALHDPEPWQEAVATSTILDLLTDAVRKHVVLLPDAAVAVALWIAHTWVHERFDHSPRLGITSPTKRCGKSTLMELLRAICRRTLKADNISASGVFRTVEALRPLTLLVDEADTFIKDNEELRGVLNSGFEKSGQVIRVVEINGDFVPVAFATFAPVALAAIGELPSTLADRSIPIRMERKAPGDSVQKMRAGQNRARLADLARMLARWSQDTVAALPADPYLPDALNDREGDICVALLAVAEHAGPAWAARARTALLTVFNLRAENDGNLETGAQLLGDLKIIFLGTSSEQMTSADLCKRLVDMDDRPWPEWKAGKPMTQVQLANALRPFRIRPTTIRIGLTTPRGYPKEAFEEAWSRYLPTAKTSSPAEAGASEPKHQNNRANSTSYGENGAATRRNGLHPQNSQHDSQEQQCCGVADADPPVGPYGQYDDEVAL
jgi:Protein of unknown function (DUF3631)